MAHCLLLYPDVSNDRNHEREEGMDAITTMARTLTDEALAERLIRLAHENRAYDAQTRQALMLEAAQRLDKKHDA
jgi:hypothetical protein